MSDCRWCKGTGKYYPLTGDPQPCKECQPMTGGPVSVHAESGVANFDKQIAESLRYWTSKIVGIAQRQMPINTYGYINLYKDSAKSMRLVYTKREFHAGDIVFEDEVEMDLSKCPAIDSNAVERLGLMVCTPKRSQRNTASVSNEISISSSTDTLLKNPGI